MGSRLLGRPELLLRLLELLLGLLELLRLLELLLRLLLELLLLEPRRLRPWSLSLSWWWSRVPTHQKV